MKSLQNYTVAACLARLHLGFDTFSWLQDEYLEAMLAKLEDFHSTAHRIHDAAAMRVVDSPPPSPPAPSSESLADTLILIEETIRRKQAPCAAAGNGRLS